ncbi:MAG: HAD family hydrolase [bacterium]|nr:HAD family hydrolase [bacterium]
MLNIKHIWFDLDGTLAIPAPAFSTAHAELKYKTYSEIVKKPVTEELALEYETLYKKHASNSAVFRSLGLPSDYWQQRFNTLDEVKFYEPEPKISRTLEQLRSIVPVSLFTNVKPEKNLKMLAAVGICSDLFTHILTGDDIKERKPSLDGFHAMIEKSKLPPEQILYVGDRIHVDIQPAKAVGMKTCLAWSISDEADFSFTNFGDILSLFR